MDTNNGQARRAEHEEPRSREVRPGRSFRHSSWREGVLTRAEELRALLGWVTAKTKDSQAENRQAEDQQRQVQVLTDAVRLHLRAATSAATQKRRWPWLASDRALFDRATSNLDTAEVLILNFAPPEYVLGQLPSVLNAVERNLDPDDPRRQAFESIAQRLGVEDPERPLREQERSSIASAKRGANHEALRYQLSVNTFRNIVLVTTFVMTVLATAIGFIGYFSPTTIPLCFQPENSGQTLVVCPTGQSTLVATTPQSGSAAPDINGAIQKTVGPDDLFIVELVGLSAASVSAVNRIRGLRRSSDPWAVQVALAVLKLPTGALTAFLGILLMRGQFVPGLGALDTPGQILAWAAVFGYAQQLFTRYVDQQAYTLLAPAPRR
jgi:hypothetical protein